MNFVEGIDHVPHEVGEPDPFFGVNRFLTLYDTDIKAAASRETGSRHYVDKDDVAQAIRQAVFNEWSAFSRIEELKTLRAMFRRRARQYIAKEVTDYMYFTGSFIYTPAQIRQALQDSTWTDVDTAPDLDARADMLAAWQQLSPATRKAVYERYGLGLEIAEMTPAAWRAAYRGVDEIADYMNRLVPAAIATEEVA